LIRGSRVAKVLEAAACPEPSALKEVVMKKTIKKLTLHRETLLSLSSFRRVVGGGIKTVDGTQCVTNCVACNFTQGTNCC
jgi:hypothetical protein